MFLKHNIWAIAYFAWCLVSSISLLQRPLTQAAMYADTNISDCERCIRWAIMIIHFKMLFSILTLNNQKIWSGFVLVCANTLSKSSHPEGSFVFCQGEKSDVKLFIVIDLVTTCKLSQTLESHLHKLLCVTLVGAFPMVQCQGTQSSKKNVAVKPFLTYRNAFNGNDVI